MKNLYIIGSGGFSKQVIEIVEEINAIKPKYQLIGIIDDDDTKISQEVLGYPIIGNKEYLKRLSHNEEIYGVIAIAIADHRLAIDQELDQVKWVNLIHPSVVLSKYTKLGYGNILCGGVIVNPLCTIGNHCHLNIGVTLGHDVLIENYVTIMPGANISGNVIIEKKSTIGTGAIVLQGLKVAEETILGAGAVLIKDSVPNSTYIGVPAKKKD